MTNPVSFINQYANHPVHLCHMYDIKLTPLYLKLNDAHSGWDWFIMHVKLGHSMDNGFIFKKKKLKLKCKREKKILGAV